MGKLTIPSIDFEKELAAGQVNPAMKAAGGTAVAGALFRVPHPQLREIEGFNVRVDTPDYLQHIQELKASMKSEGYFIDKPMAGYVAKEDDAQIIFITDGYSRYRAVSELIAEGAEGFGEDFAIPTIVKPTATNLEDLTVALVLGNEGRPLSVYERAIAAKRLVNMGVEEPRIAERLGVTTRYIADLLVLAGASAKVRNMVINGKVAPTEAIKQLRKDGAKAAEKLEAGVKAAAEAGKTKATAKDVKKGSGETDKKSEDPELKMGVSSSIFTRDGKTTVKISYAFKAGDIVDIDVIKPVRLFNDSDWWNFVDPDTKEHVVIEKSIGILVQVVTAAEDDTFDTGDTPTTEAAGALTDQTAETEDDTFDAGSDDDDTFADGDADAEKVAEEASREADAEDEL